MDRAALLKHASLHKGLTNYSGQNNCFLNVIIQSLWHLDSFRVLISSADHASLHAVDDPCLLCELREIFAFYEFSDETALAPDNVRIALDVLCRERFAVGRMADATETLDTILAFMHADQCRSNVATDLGSSLAIKDMTCEPRCIAHALFEADMFDVHHCQSCAATSDPDLWRDTLYRVYFAELYKYVERPGFFSTAPADGGAHKFASVLKALLNDGPGRSCPDHDTTGCPGHCRIERWLMKLPIVFAISIVWPSASVGGKELKAFAEVIPHHLDLGHVFQLGGAAADMPAADKQYLFRGMVCYYGQHYVSFFRSQSADGAWLLFDDKTVRTVGTWDDVRQRVERGCYQPTILFWEKEQLQYEQLESLADIVHHRSSSVDETPSSPTSPARPSLPANAFSTRVEDLVELEPHLPALEALDTLDALDIALEVSRPSSPATPQSPAALLAHTKAPISPAAALVAQVKAPTSPIVAPLPVAKRLFVVLQGAEAHSLSGWTTVRVQLTAADGGLGLALAKKEGHVVVSALEANAAGDALPAAASGAIDIGDRLLRVDDHDLATWTLYQVMELLITTETPMTLTFARRVPWLCARCTLINTPDATACGACEQPK
ncbi:inactive ubiquitin carboxyl-terminal hydrolase [Achlya hypogyna]|uniref:Inactive ubiquitin carboxyl-terminal hydrolase n=1 Tax=Achlya hypogyna TaxID=1202772 RepID=A0A1V9YI54_ACHHY|nr:inactive ubiquitin carboxyl-terminal hydrolase [Achlya hypogyna]